jgi:manganese-transporting P-type ATPase
MRKIIFATERVTVDSRETVYFIAVLVVFAVLASTAVLSQGLRDENRNKFRLALHCIMIITSVIPPELPMELSLAVTNSLAALARELVFCTEPYRIPFAGKLDVMCFDKTGTLTKDTMILRGVACPCDFDRDLGPDELLTAILEPSSCSDMVASIMGACHSVFVSDGRLTGDPMEITAVEASGFQFEVASRGGLGQVKNVQRNISVTLKHRFPFSSALKRMSMIVDLEGFSSSASYVLTKGGKCTVTEMPCCPIGDWCSVHVNDTWFHIFKINAIYSSA